MRLVMAILGLAGLGAAIALVANQGAGEITGAVLAAGWGLLAVIAFDALPLTIDSMAWRRELSISFNRV